MPRLPKYSNFKLILLKAQKGQFLFWQGQKEKKDVIDEEPLILNFDGEDFYFYSSDIKEEKKAKNMPWIFFKTKLDFNKQKKVIEWFTKKMIKKIYLSKIFC